MVSGNVGKKFVQIKNNEINIIYGFSTPYVIGSSFVAVNIQL
jgi:hypothetical protein